MTHHCERIEVNEEVIMGGCTNIQETENDLSTMEMHISELEEENMKIKQILKDAEAQMKVTPLKVNGASINAQTPQEKAEADARSIYVGNVDYSVKPEELEKHFFGCGVISRVTIPCDKFSGHPKGFAYIEFSDCEGSANALAMNDSLLKGRQIKVIEKRTNTPGFSTTNRKPRGRGGFNGRGRGGFKGQQIVIVKYIYPGQRGRGRGQFKPRGFSAY